MAACANNPVLEINTYIPVTEVEGPFHRFSIWMQGCSIRCKGCKNRHMWESGKGRVITVKDMASLILQYEQIEGITIVGGEPFDQAGPLSILCRELRSVNLGIVIFTGYSYLDIISGGTDEQKQLFDLTDLLIDGPYIAERQTVSMPWVGSDNQHYVHISGRYKSVDFTAIQNRHEVRVDLPQRNIDVNGMGSFYMGNRLLSEMNMQGSNSE
jgi:anaerobic ribonucleoside-triphosphate reductase activating protein